MHGLTKDRMLETDPEIVCLVSGHDETFAQTVHAKTSYDKGDIRWGARFRDMYVGDVVRVTIDLTRLHVVDPVDPPDVL